MGVGFGEHGPESLYPLRSIHLSGPLYSIPHNSLKQVYLVKVNQDLWGDLLVC